MTTTEEALVGVYAKLTELQQTMARQNSLVEVLLERVVDSTHVSIAELATLHKISKSAAHARWGQWLEQIPGTKRYGVPRDRIGDGYVPVAVARRYA